jgi:hypothetical protein
MQKVLFVGNAAQLVESMVSARTVSHVQRRKHVA